MRCFWPPPLVVIWNRRTQPALNLAEVAAHGPRRDVRPETAREL